MSGPPDFFRDFGVLPNAAVSSTRTVRAYFSWGQVVGQYLMTFLMTGVGVALALYCEVTLPFPANLLGAVASFAGFGYIVYRATRNDYSWVELDGGKLRSKHLYSRRVVERSIEEIEAIVHRMSELGAIDAEIIDFAGKPLVRRIHWKEPRQTRG